MPTLKHLLSIAALFGCFWLGPALSADIPAGEQKAAACAGCHGAKGKSNNVQWPNLAAQQQTYLINQLTAFKSGSRNNPMMQAMAANLSDTDIANLGAYFSSLPAVSSGGDATLAKAGQAKASMCLGCHGAKAEGNGQIPRLAGQQPDYLATQLTNFKQGDRKSGPMQSVASNLSETDIQELAAYLSAL